MARATLPATVDQRHSLLQLPTLPATVNVQQPQLLTLPVTVNARQYQALMQLSVLVLTLLA